MRRAPLLCFLTLALAPAAVRSEDIILREAYPEEGVFVRLPSALFGIPIGVAGALAGALLVCPGKALLNTRKAAHGGVVAPAALGAGSHGCVGDVALEAFYIGNAAGGFAFLALKRVFWEAPRAALKKEAP